MQGVEFNFSFSKLLLENGFALNETLIVRNRPFEKKLNKLLPNMICERPDLFTAYQSCQSRKLEKAMLKARYFVSFVGLEAGSAHFVKLYEIGTSTPLSHQEFWHVPAHLELRECGYEGFTEEFAKQQESQLRFELQEIDQFSKWTGRLVLNWPPPEISWWRQAANRDFTVKAILQENCFHKSMPDWKELVLDWTNLGLLPTSWKARLSLWRGVYLIRDSSDGKLYVGSASGAENLLGRWQNYLQLGHGGNKHLRNRNPRNFVFSILQILAHDTPKDEVEAFETSWKKRLQSQYPEGLNDN